MKVSQTIRNKMRKIAELSTKHRRLVTEVDEYFINKGYDIELLRSGDGISLEELDYGNDITDLFCNWIETDFKNFIEYTIRKG